MKVLHIAPTPFFSDRGCHLRILGEVDQLRRLGHEIMITTYHIGRDVKGLNTNRIVNIPWYNKLEAGGSWHKLYLDLLLIWTSFRTYRRFQPHVIHGHLHEGALIGWLVSLLASRGRTPVIFDVQGSLSGELESYGLIKPKSLLKVLCYGVEKLICKLPDYLVCSSMANTNFVKDEMKVPDHKVMTLLDGIDPGLFSLEPDEEWKVDLDINPKKKIVLYSGSLMQSKGIDFLLKAIPQIIKDFSNVQFLILGHPTEGCQRRAREMNIDRFIHFTGKVNYFELPKYLRLADVAVDPKANEAGEGSGKILNYMAAGLPVVCFDTVNNRSLLGKNGFFAMPRNSGDLADKIVYALRNDSLASTVGKLNRERVNEKFTWEASVRMLSDVYSKATLHQNLD